MNDRQRELVRVSRGVKADLDSLVKKYDFIFNGWLAEANANEPIRAHQPVVVTERDASLGAYAVSVNHQGGGLIVYLHDDGIIEVTVYRNGNAVAGVTVHPQEEPTKAIDNTPNT